MDLIRGPLGMFKLFHERFLSILKLTPDFFKNYQSHLEQLLQMHLLAG